MVHDRPGNLRHLRLRRLLKLGDTPLRGNELRRQLVAHPRGIGWYLNGERTRSRTLARAADRRSRMEMSYGLFRSAPGDRQREVGESPLR